MSEAEPKACEAQGRPIDAYLAHNTADKGFVRQIDQHLRTLGVETWFDERNFPKFGDGVLEMSRALDACKRLVVFFGRKGTGPIQQLEISAAVRNSRKVIVVLLPDATPDDLILNNPQLTMFSGFLHHRFRAVEDEDALLQLWEAITDKTHPSRTKPPEPPASPWPQRTGLSEPVTSSSAAGRPSDFDVFLSYAREDRERAARLADELAGQGYSVFWDLRVPPGKTWRNHIFSALAKSRCVVVIWSTQSVDSDWVIEEADEGKKRGILIPVLYDSVDPPFGFRSIQAADLTQWTVGTRPESLQDVLNGIADLVRVA